MGYTKGRREGKEEKRAGNCIPFRTEPGLTFHYLPLEQARRHQQELRKVLQTALELPGQQQPTALALPALRTIPQRLRLRQAGTPPPLLPSPPLISLRPRSTCHNKHPANHRHNYSKQQKLEKKIPGTPENETPVHLRRRQIFSHNLSSIRAPDRPQRKKPEPEPDHTPPDAGSGPDAEAK